MLHATEAKKLMQENKKFFSEMMQSLEKRIKDRAESGHSMMSYDFIKGISIDNKQKVIDELILAGYEIEGVSDGLGIKIFWIDLT